MGRGEAIYDKMGKDTIESESPCYDFHIGLQALRSSVINSSDNQYLKDGETW